MIPSGTHIIVRGLQNALQPVPFSPVTPPLTSSVRDGAELLEWSETRESCDVWPVCFPAVSMKCGLEALIAVTLIAAAVSPWAAIILSMVGDSLSICACVYVHLCCC